MLVLILAGVLFSASIMQARRKGGVWRRVMLGGSTVLYVSLSTQELTSVEHPLMPVAVVGGTFLLAAQVADRKRRVR